MPAAQRRERSPPHPAAAAAAAHHPPLDAEREAFVNGALGGLCGETLRTAFLPMALRWLHRRARRARARVLTGATSYHAKFPPAEATRLLGTSSRERLVGGRDVNSNNTHTFGGKYQGEEGPRAAESSPVANLAEDPLSPTAAEGIRKKKKTVGISIMVDGTATVVAPQSSDGGDGRKGGAAKKASPAMEAALRAMAVAAARDHAPLACLGTAALARLFRDIITVDPSAPRGTTADGMAQSNQLGFGGVAGVDAPPVSREWAMEGEVITHVGSPSPSCGLVVVLSGTVAIRAVGCYKPPPPPATCAAAADASGGPLPFTSTHAAQNAAASMPSSSALSGSYPPSPLFPDASEPAVLRAAFRTVPLASSHGRRCLERSLGLGPRVAAMASEGALAGHEVSMEAPVVIGALASALAGRPSTWQLVALTDCDVLFVPASRLVAVASSVMLQVPRPVRRGLLAARRQCLAERYFLSSFLLRQSWVMDCLSHASLERLRRRLVPLCFFPGEVIVEGGGRTPCRGLYFVRRGRVAFREGEDSNTHADMGVLGAAFEGEASADSAGPSGSNAFVVLGERSLVFGDHPRHTIVAAGAVANVGPSSHSSSSTCTVVSDGLCDVWFLPRETYDYPKDITAEERARVVARGVAMRERALERWRRGAEGEAALDKLFAAAFGGCSGATSGTPNTEEMGADHMTAAHVVSTFASSPPYLAGAPPALFSLLARLATPRVMLAYACLGSKSEWCDGAFVVGAGAASAQVGAFGLASATSVAAAMPLCGASAATAGEFCADFPQTQTVTASSAMTSPAASSPHFAAGASLGAGCVIPHRWPYAVCVTTPSAVVWHVPRAALIFALERFGLLAAAVRFESRALGHAASFVSAVASAPPQQNGSSTTVSSTLASKADGDVDIAALFSHYPPCDREDAMMMGTNASDGLVGYSSGDLNDAEGGGEEDRDTADAAHSGGGNLSSPLAAMRRRVGAIADKLLAAQPAFTFDHAAHRAEVASASSGGKSSSARRRGDGAAGKSAHAVTKGDAGVSSFRSPPTATGGSISSVHEQNATERAHHSQATFMPTNSLPPARGDDTWFSTAERNASYGPAALTAAIAAAMRLPSIEQPSLITSFPEIAAVTTFGAAAVAIFAASGGAASMGGAGGVKPTHVSHAVPALAARRMRRPSHYAAPVGSSKTLPALPTAARGGGVIGGGPMLFDDGHGGEDSAAAAVHLPHAGAPATVPSSLLAQADAFPSLPLRRPHTSNGARVGVVGGGGIGIGIGVAGGREGRLARLRAALGDGYWRDEEAAEAAEDAAYARAHASDEEEEDEEEDEEGDEEDAASNGTARSWLALEGEEDGDGLAATLNTVYSFSVANSAAGPADGEGEGAGDGGAGSIRGVPAVEEGLFDSGRGTPTTGGPNATGEAVDHRLLPASSFTVPRDANTDADNGALNPTPWYASTQQRTPHRGTPPSVVFSPEEGAEANIRADRRAGFPLPPYPHPAFSSSAAKKGRQQRQPPHPFHPQRPHTYDPLPPRIAIDGVGAAFADHSAAVAEAAFSGRPFYYSTEATCTAPAAVAMPSDTNSGSGGSKWRGSGLRRGAVSAARLAVGIDVEGTAAGGGSSPPAPVSAADTSSPSPHGQRGASSAAYANASSSPLHSPLPSAPLSLPLGAGGAAAQSPHPLNADISQQQQQRGNDETENGAGGSGRGGGLLQALLQGDGSLVRGLGRTTSTVSAMSAYSAYSGFSAFSAASTTRSGRARRRRKEKKGAADGGDGGGGTAAGGGDIDYFEEEWRAVIMGGLGPNPSNTNAHSSGAGALAGREGAAGAVGSSAAAARAGIGSGAASSNLHGHSNGGYDRSTATALRSDWRLYLRAVEGALFAGMGAGVSIGVGGLGDIAHLCHWRSGGDRAEEGARPAPPMSLRAAAATAPPPQQMAVIARRLRRLSADAAKNAKTIKKMGGGLLEGMARGGESGGRRGRRWDGGAGPDPPAAFFSAETRRRRSSASDRRDFDARLAMEALIADSTRGASLLLLAPTTRSTTARLPPPTAPNAVIHNNASRTASGRTAGEEGRDGGDVRIPLAPRPPLQRSVEGPLQPPSSLSSVSSSPDPPAEKVTDVNTIVEEGNAGLLAATVSEEGGSGSVPSDTKPMPKPTLTQQRTCGSGTALKKGSGFASSEYLLCLRRGLSGRRAESGYFSDIQEDPPKHTGAKKSTITAAADPLGSHVQSGAPSRASSRAASSCSSTSSTVPTASTPSPVTHSRTASERHVHASRSNRAPSPLSHHPSSASTKGLLSSASSRRVASSLRGGARIRATVLNAAGGNGDDATAAGASVEPIREAAAAICDDEGPAAAHDRGESAVARPPLPSLHVFEGAAAARSSMSRGATSAILLAPTAPPLPLKRRRPSSSSQAAASKGSNGAPLTPTPPPAAVSKSLSGETPQEPQSTRQAAAEALALAPLPPPADSSLDLDFSTPCILSGGAPIAARPPPAYMYGGGGGRRRNSATGAECGGFTPRRGPPSVMPTGGALRRPKTAGAFW